MRHRDSGACFGLLQSPTTSFIVEAYAAYRSPQRDVGDGQRIGRASARMEKLLDRVFARGNLSALVAGLTGHNSGQWSAGHSPVDLVVGRTHRVGTGDFQALLLEVHR